MKDWLSKTGWTEEDWKEHISNFLLWAGVFVVIFLAAHLG